MARNLDSGRRDMPRYRLIRSRRRTLALIVRPDQTVEVRCPPGMPQRQIDRFVLDRLDWIRTRQQESSCLIPLGPVGTADVKEADLLIRARVCQLSERHMLPLVRVIRIRDLVSRWGSCSSKGSISINRRCARLPGNLLDYVILHEFCHLRHLNHGKAFWHELHQLLPDAPYRRKQLKQYYPSAHGEEVGHSCQNGEICANRPVTGKDRV